MRSPSLSTFPQKFSVQFSTRLDGTLFRVHLLRIQDPLRIKNPSHVCRRWRGVALEDSLFWSNIFAGTKSSVEFARRARDAPLTVYASIWKKGRLPLSVPMRFHTRISKLHITIGNHVQGIWCFLRLLYSTAATLESLTLYTKCHHNPAGAVVLFSGSTPKYLRDFTLVN